MDFSVSTLIYEKDNPQYFEIALESIFQQTVKPTEVVLIVDGPVPKVTSQVIERLENSYENLKVVRLKKNVGHGEARRLGLANCSYDLVAIVDGDDICAPDRFEKQLLCFESDKDLSVVGGYSCEFEGDVNNVTGIRKSPLGDSEIKQYLKSRSPFNQPTVMFRKCYVDSAGGFMDWYCDEDYYLWIRMFLAGYKFKNLPENLMFVRMDEDSYTRRGGLRYFKSEAALQIYMYKHKVIGFIRLIINILIRFVVQVLISSRLRGWVFKKFFRTKKG
ncbi:MAG: glycosyltransferase [Planctomycetes bacterium]|nr:glycosyltransferase [Planctomycetota bacterium]